MTHLHCYLQRDNPLNCTYHKRVSPSVVMRRLVRGFERSQVTTNASCQSHFQHAQHFRSEGTNISYCNKIGDASLSLFSGIINTYDNTTPTAHHKFCHSVDK